MKLAYLVAAAFVAPTVALADCNKPTPPAAVDGATATMDQLMSAKAGVTGFMTASDAYQECVLADVKSKTDAAKKAKTKVDPAVKKQADAAISANQSEKEKVGADFNAAVKAYKGAHPS